MHYESIHDLPPPVRRVLPEPAQEIYRGTFNDSWEENAATAAREQAAEEAAWEAVKTRFEKVGDAWRRRQRPA